MDDKKTFLLGSKDIVSKDIEDLFINISLNRTFSEIRDGKYENIFDVEKQFTKERNTSRDFRIYGTIDSLTTDCDNLSLDIYSSSGVTGLSGFIKTVNSSSLVYDGLNVYRKKRGKYLIELNSYTENYIYIRIPSNNIGFIDQIYKQQVVFYEADGTFIDYGTKTIEIDDSGNATEINNDFYFLYNKHWIKKELKITEETKAIVSFSALSPTTITKETSQSTIQSTSSLFSIALDKPSTFGIEKVDLSVLTSTLNPLTEIIVTDDNFIGQNLPLTLNFSIGEQTKNLYFMSPNDTLQEFTENVTFQLSNYQFVTSGASSTHTFSVLDNTPSNKVNLNFQNVYQNRNYFSGIEQTVSNLPAMYPMSAVLRSGLEYEGTPMEFYPSDDFTITIRNLGSTNILPINPKLGIYSEQIFSANTVLTFSVNTEYQNTEKHSIRFYFGEYNKPSTPNINAFYSGFTLNGIPIVDYYKTYTVDYEKFLACLKNTTVASMNNVNISGWNRFSDLTPPFEVSENLSALTITITSKNPGTRLDINNYGFNLNLFDISNLNLKDLGMSAETIQEFVYSPQIPLDITLRANTNSNLQAKYFFSLAKKGFTTMSFTTSELNASTATTSYYLASGYHEMLRNWDNDTNEPIYVHSGVTSNWNTNASSGLYTSGEVYINGIVFLSRYSFNNTTPSNSTNSTIINKSRFGNLSSDYKADFLPTPILTIPATSEFYSPQSRKQKGLLRIEPKLLSSNAPIMDRSFEFRTGTTDVFTTYYHGIDKVGNTSPLINSQFDSALGWWSYAGRTYSSGNTINSSGPFLLKQFLQDGIPQNNIQSQGMYGISPIVASEFYKVSSAYNISSSPNNFIELSAPEIGIPFEIKNIKGFRNLNGSVFNDDAKIEYLAILPNEIAGVTINQANNKMGGYSLTRPSAPISQSLKKVSFDSGILQSTGNGNIAIINISLDSDSINGNETAIISIEPVAGTSNNAVLGFDYSDSDNPLPLTLTWAVGEKDKTINLNNTMPAFNNSTLFLNLEISSINNLNIGTYNTKLIMFHN